MNSSSFSDKSAKYVFANLAVNSLEFVMETQTRTPQNKKANDNYILLNVDPDN
jgi:hypothetical protein